MHKATYKCFLATFYRRSDHTSLPVGIVKTKKKIEEKQRKREKQLYIYGARTFDKWIIVKIFNDIFIWMMVVSCLCECKMQCMFITSMQLCNKTQFSCFDDQILSINTVFYVTHIYFSVNIIRWWCARCIFIREAHFSLFHRSVNFDVLTLQLNRSWNSGENISLVV